MKQKSRYVFGAALAGAAFGGVPELVQRAHAAPITAAAFTFESSYSSFFPSSTGTAPATVTASTTATGTASKTTLTTGTNTTTSYASITGSSVGPFTAESGSGSAYGVHASTKTIFSRQVGNGSAQSFSSSVWNDGDYYEFDVPTSGLNSLLVSFDQGASGTGPHAFTLYYSPDGATASGSGTDFVSLSTYSVFGAIAGTQTATTNFAGSGSASDTRFGVSIDLSGVTSVNDDAYAAFRLVDSDTIIASSYTAGTNRVDNFVVSGTAITNTPEPVSVSLLAVGAAALVRRRKNS